MRKVQRALLLFGLLAVAFAIMVLLGARSRSRTELQRYKAGLRASGEKLTYAELVPVRAANSNDSYSLLINAVAQMKGPGSYPGILEIRKYVSPGQARIAWKGDGPVWTMWSNSGASSTRGTWEDFAAHLDADRDALEQIREALKKPATDARPRTNILHSPRINFVAIRTAAQWLAGAAINDLRLGRLEEALENLEALAGLAQMNRDDPTLVAQMIRVAVATCGLRTAWEALQAPGWTEPQLARLQNAWGKLALIEVAERGFVGERVGGIEFWDLARSGSGRKFSQFLSVSSGGPSALKLTFEDAVFDYVGFPAYKATSIDADELFYLKTMQEAITALRLLKARHPWAEAKQRLDASFAAIDRISGSTERFRHLLSMMSIPNYQKCGETVVYAETERQMTIAAIALKRFELRHGKLPPDLASLVPEFLPELPYDCMSGKPLCYRLKPAAGFLLYSVGQDGRDDGGDPNPASSKGFELWDGRDAVWPSPAK
jgi:hypothetical protein